MGISPCTARSVAPFALSAPLPAFRPSLVEMCGTGCCNFLASTICAYLIPPLGIWWRFGCGLEFFVCFLLTCLGYVPGVIYAACMIGCEPPKARELELEEARAAS